MAEPFDHVVVGSGAGGGTVAARLAESGARVLLLEAGGDPRALQGRARDMVQDARLPDDYDVPAFHPFASENAAMRWDFWVSHYRDRARQMRDPKARAIGHRPGVLYPRAGTLGGCTAHNAMIFIYPHAEDWRRIETITGDPGWAPEAMHRHFRKLEDCRYRVLQEGLAGLGIDRTGHGWGGWLPVERAIPAAALGDEDLMAMILTSVRQIAEESPDIWRRLRWFIESAADPNDIDRIEAAAEGLCFTPLTTLDGHRRGSRERVLDVTRRHPDRLVVELDALATRVVLDDRNRAVGVDYLKGAELYRAHARPSETPGIPRHAAIRGEVILAGGAFNTPQLLMLSGIGDPADLARFGIAARVPLPGVGRNLQDRYEISVVNRMDFESWDCLKGARHARGDPLWQDWAKDGSGLYATNGAGIGVITRSDAERPLPDLFCMALLARFDGYFPGYAARLAEGHNYLTWAILKAHTENTAGRVQLASADPRDLPAIDFNYFSDGSPGHEADMKAMVEGVKYVRRLAEPLCGAGAIAAEELPGAHVESDAAIATYVRDNAWGHHASCSCPIGKREAGGVLDSRLRVHGTHGLRVADASVFPRIPGFFIACAVYMVGEKAAEMILEDAARPSPAKGVRHGL